jgi:hypothetical protein
MASPASLSRDINPTKLSIYDLEIQTSFRKSQMEKQGRPNSEIEPLNLQLKELQAQIEQAGPRGREEWKNCIREDLKLAYAVAQFIKSVYDKTEGADLFEFTTRMNEGPFSQPSTLNGVALELNEVEVPRHIHTPIGNLVLGSASYRGGSTAAIAQAIHAGLKLQKIEAPDVGNNLYAIEAFDSRILGPVSYRTWEQRIPDDLRHEFKEFWSGLVQISIPD